MPASRTSSITFLIRSSNSPRYLDPATMADKSRVSTRFPLTESGTAPSAICPARPSTMAVFPTPGSPIRQGLFLVLRLNVWISLRISSSRPIQGSSFFSLASAVKSRLYCSRAGTPFPWLFPFLAYSSRYSRPVFPIESKRALYSSRTFTSMVFKRRLPAHSTSLSMAIRMCSVPVSFSLNRTASWEASLSTCSARGVNPGRSARHSPPSGAINSSRRFKVSSSTFRSMRSCEAALPDSRRRAMRMCSVPT